MRLLTAVMLSVALCSLAGAQDTEAQDVQEAKVLASWDFETQDMAGIGSGPETDASVLIDEAKAYSGKGCLEAFYVMVGPMQQGQDPPGLIMLPLDEAHPETRALHFAVYLKVAAPVVVVLAERETEARYVAMVWCPGDQWNEVTLALDEFIPDRDGPVDPDGTLNPGNIAGIGFADASAFMAGAADDPMFASPPPVPERFMRLDAIQLLDQAPTTKQAPEGTVQIGRYEPPLKWIAFLGGQERTIETVAGDEHHALKIDHKTPSGTIIGAMHLINPGQLAGVEQLHLFAASKKQTMLMLLAVEQAEAGGEGPAYMTPLQIQKPGEWKEFNIPVSQLTLDENAFDPNGRLDMDRVMVVAVVDMHSAQPGGDLENTIWISELLGLKAAE